MNIILTKDEAVDIIEAIYSYSHRGGSKSLVAISEQMRIAFNYPREEINSQRFSGEELDWVERDPELDAAIAKAEPDHREYAWDRIAMQGRHALFWKMYPEYGVVPRKTPAHENERLALALAKYEKCLKDDFAAKLSLVSGQITLSVAL